MAQGRGRGQTLPAWMTQGGNDAALDSMLASASQAAAQRERPGGDEPAPKRRSRFDDGPPQQPPPPQGGGWGAPPPANGGWGAPPPAQGGWGQPPQAGGGWGAAAPQEDPRIAAAKRAAAAFSSGAAAPPPPAGGGRGRGLTTPAWMSQAPAAAAPPKPTSPRANDPRARNKAPAMPTAPPMPSSAPPPRDAWDGVGAPPPVPLPPAPAFTGSDAARKALERMGAAPPAPPPAPAPAPPPPSNPEDAEKAARARIKELQNAGTDDYQKKDFQAALASYKGALQLLDDLKRDVPATSSRVNAERDERRMKVLSCVAKTHEKLGNAQEAKDASRACDKIQKRLSEYKRRARK